MTQDNLATSDSLEAHVERLYHFRCSSLTCNKWWSIGDWVRTPYIYCPHCGLNQNVVYIETGESHS